MEKRCKCSGCKCKKSLDSTNESNTQKEKDVVNDKKN